MLKINSRIDQIKASRTPKVDVYAASFWPSEAQEWMDVAVRLDSESGRGRNEQINHSKLNIAHVCTGLAFELAYKSLIVAEFKLPKKTHNLVKLHIMLKDETKTIIDEWSKMAGWKDYTNLLEYLDKRMSHPDRKYWMHNPWKTAKTRVTEGTGFIIADGIMTIPGLAPILNKLACLGSIKLQKARQRHHLLNNFLITYFPINEFHNAIKDYGDAIDQDPEFGELYCDRAIIWLHMKDWQKAKEDWMIAENLNANIVSEFHNWYECIEDFEQRSKVILPDNITSLLRS